MTLEMNTDFNLFIISIWTAFIDHVI
jgi:hypothetical protein